MPPVSSQKGTGKKGAGAIARQRSRNTTPLSSAPAPAPLPPIASLPPVENTETEYLDLNFEVFRSIGYEDLVDTPASNAALLDSKGLDAIMTRLTRLQQIVEKRGASCDRGMRLLSGSRKARIDELALEREREEERLRRQAAEDEEKEREKKHKGNKKKRKAVDAPTSKGTVADRSSPTRDATTTSKIPRARDSMSSSLSAPGTPTAMEVDDKAKVAAEAEEKAAESDSSSSSDDGAPPPRRLPQANTFGEDPSTFPDPTVYEILPVQPGMSEEEKKAIYSVAVYPHDDLSTLIAGDPPDKDFSSGKVSNQISFATFSTYADQFFRPFSEEDLGFLRDRGDRVTPFVLPKRGARHYTELWAEEDGSMVVDSSPGRDRLPHNTPRGIIDQMSDDVAETDKLSVGPLLSRLLQAFRPEHRAPVVEESKPYTNGVNGDANMMDLDISMNGLDSFDASQQLNGNGVMNGNTNGTPVPDGTIPPAAYMPESLNESWKKATQTKLDYSQVDERIKQELRHIGFLPSIESLTNTNNPNGSLATNGRSSTAPNADAVAQQSQALLPAHLSADYDNAYDDEVAARLRLLQARLRDQVLINGARKARLTDLVRERMAHQEYQTILEDLDTQVQAAYLKRTRTLGKTKKKPHNRPGASASSAVTLNGNGPNGAGIARPGIGDLTKTLMERRRRWIDVIGPVFDGEKDLGKVPRVKDPGSSIFQPGEMAEVMRKEKDTWEEEVEED